MTTKRILIVVAALIFGASVGYYGDKFTSKRATPCRGGYKYHNFGSWTEAGKSDRTFTHDRMLMQRRCTSCGHIQTKESD